MTEKCPICGKEDPAGLVTHLWKAHGIHKSQGIPKIEKKKKKSSEMILVEEVAEKKKKKRKTKKTKEE